MKKRTRRISVILVLALALTAVFFTFPAGADPADSGIHSLHSFELNAQITPQTVNNGEIKPIEVELDGKTVKDYYPGAVRFKLEFTDSQNPNGMYFVSVYSGNLDKAPDLLKSSAMPVYVNQYDADGSGRVQCTELEAPYPSSLGNGIYTVFANNTKIATFEAYSKGVAVTGQVTSYRQETGDVTLTLYQSGTKEEVQTVKLPGSQKYGSDTQPFTFNCVIEGTYDLMISKPGHIDSMVKNIEVAAAPVDLQNHFSKEIRNITLVSGDADHNGVIGPQDAALIFTKECMGHKAKDCPFCDADGNGVIGPQDAALIFTKEFMGKNLGKCTYNY